MRICYVADVGVKISGGHQSLLNLIDEVIKEGIEPYIVCHKEWELTEVARKKGIPVCIIKGISPVIAQGDVVKKLLEVPAKQIVTVITLPRAKKFLRENQINAVHLNSALSCDLWAEAALSIGIPYLWHLREFLDADHKLEFLNSKKMNFLFKNAASVITISHAIQKNWEKRIGRKSDLIYNGLPIQGNYGVSDEKFKDDVIKCVIIGRVMETKGQMEAVKAIELLVNRGLRNFRLTIIGYRGISEFEKFLRKYIVDHNLESYVSVMDFTYDLKGYREASDIGLVCSRAEAFGRVTIEYMLAGLLVIGANSGATSELIADGATGYLYETGKPEDLARVLLRCSGERKSCVQIAQKGQEEAMNSYLIERTAENVCKLYKKVIGCACNAFGGGGGVTEDYRCR